jgi:hypothetical protein
MHAQRAVEAARERRELAHLYTAQVRVRVAGVARVHRERVRTHQSGTLKKKTKTLVHLKLQIYASYNVSLIYTYRVRHRG